MKVAFISRATLYSSPGGDTKQVVMTAENLRSLGVTVNIYLTTEAMDYAAYDLLHFFNVIRPADILPHVLQSKTPFVISTIFVDYSVYERTVRKGLAGLLFRMFSADAVEYLKALARALKNGEKIRSMRYLMSGHRRSVKYLLKKAAMLLPNSENEYKRLLAAYGPGIAPYRVVPNGIDAAAANYPPNPMPGKNGVVCGARIEGRKNQLGLIKAIAQTSYSLTLFGTASPNHAAYLKACKDAAGPGVHFAGWADTLSLYAAFAAAKVHAMPSYFETTGLSSLEAAVLGCNLVVGDGGDVRDYFGEDVWYCDPGDVDSIASALKLACEAPYNGRLRDRILRQYTWEQAAAKTFEAYRAISGQ